MIPGFAERLESELRKLAPPTVIVEVFTIFALSAGSQLTKINIGNTGNQNHPDLEVRVVLVTCISNIDYF